MIKIQVSELLPTNNSTTRSTVLSINCLLFASLCGLLFLTLTACQPAIDESQANFFVASTGRQPGYYPQGGGWKPNSKVSISLWNEPDGPGSASTDWKHLFDVDVDSNGMFGYSSSSPFYPVRRSICGNPENGQTVVFMAKSLTTGKILMYRPGADIYFTFQPCQ